MRIAVPVTNGMLSSHFGQCEAFALLDIGSDGRTIAVRQDETPPAHEPGVLPRWLASRDVNVIIAGGMGARARNLFEDNGVQVVVGAPETDPASLAGSYLSGTLSTTSNTCSHGEGAGAHNCAH